MSDDIKMTEHSEGFPPATVDVSGDSQVGASESVSDLKTPGRIVSACF